MTLLLTDGTQVSTNVLAAPDTAVAGIVCTAVRRPLLVVVDLDPARPSLLFGSSRVGPVRRSVSLGAALGLIELGVRGVTWAPPPTGRERP